MDKATDLHTLLGRIFDDAQGDLRDELEKEHRRDEYETLKRDFIFHMTDWMGDLGHLHALALAPEVWKTRQATTFLIGFLYHVIPHLNAAGRLLLDDIPDPFVRDESVRLLGRAGEADPASH